MPCKASLPNLKVRKEVGRRFLAVICVAFLVSCTTNETAPAKVSWGDLIEGKRLERHLEERRGMLAVLTARTNLLNQNTRELQEEIDRVGIQLISKNDLSEENRQAIKELEKEIFSAQQSLIDILEKTILTLEDIREIEKTLDDSRKTQRALEKKRIELGRMEAEVDLLRRRIEAKLNLRNEFIIINK